jgi:hypothetical protein
VTESLTVHIFEFGVDTFGDELSRVFVERLAIACWMRGASMCADEVLWTTRRRSEGHFAAPRAAQSVRDRRDTGDVRAANH